MASTEGILVLFAGPFVVAGTVALTLWLVRMGDARERRAAERRGR